MRNIEVRNVKYETNIAVVSFLFFPIALKKQS